MTKYTLVQHSGGGFAGKPAFKKAVEEALITRKKSIDTVRRVGGLLFDTYNEAADRAEKENYPPGVEGLYPNAKGTFSRSKIGGLAIYIPAKG